MLLKAFCRSGPRSPDKKSDNRKVITDGNKVPVSAWGLHR